MGLGNKGEILGSTESVMILNFQLGELRTTVKTFSNLGCAQYSYRICLNSIQMYVSIHCEKQVCGSGKSAEKAQSLPYSDLGV